MLRPPHPLKHSATSFILLCARVFSTCFFQIAQPPMEAHARVLHVCSSFTSHSPKVLYLSIKDLLLRLVLLAATGDYFCVFVCLFFYRLHHLIVSHPRDVCFLSSGWLLEKCSLQCKLLNKGKKRGAFLGFFFLQYQRKLTWKLKSSKIFNTTFFVGWKWPLLFYVRRTVGFSFIVCSLTLPFSSFFVCHAPLGDGLPVHHFKKSHSNVKRIQAVTAQIPR